MTLPVTNLPKLYPYEHQAVEQEEKEVSIRRAVVAFRRTIRFRLPEPIGEHLRRRRPLSVPTLASIIASNNNNSNNNSYSSNIINSIHRCILE